MKKRVLLAATHSPIENLGLIYLLGLARDQGWDRKVVLVKNHDFKEFHETVADFKPDVVGFNAYTGAHTQLFPEFDRLKQDHSGIATIVGGPHATYFPEEVLTHADFVVMSEGFKSFRRILRGEASPGILQLEGTEPFPHPDRETFYRDSPEHGKSPIKSTIGMTGCPYKCTYCYNSTDRDAILVPEGSLSKFNDQLSLPVVDLATSGGSGMGGRLFPLNERDIESVRDEIRELMERWPTKVLYWQDDVFGFDVSPGGFLEQLAEFMPSMGVHSHGQVRWEMTDHESGLRRLDLIRQAKFNGLTLAIEAADPVVRKEVLDRSMHEEIMFEGMRRIRVRGLNVRTEQISALPYGATSVETPINLDADLDLLALNVRLRAETTGPTMAWLSTLAPYQKTKIGAYCAKFGHYSGDNSDVPDEFFKESVLRFPREWIGPELEHRKSEPSVWLSPTELERYRKQNAELRVHFNTFALIPEGHQLARGYLTSDEPFSYERLGGEIEHHLRSLSERGWVEVAGMLEATEKIRGSNFGLDGDARDDQIKTDLHKLAPYLAVLPKWKLAAQRAVRYAKEGALSAKAAAIYPHQKVEGILSSYILSTAVRHHLYDHILYEVGETH